MTVTQAAKFLNMTTGRIRQLLREGELAGEKMDNWLWLINRRSVERFAKKPQKTGRPRLGKRLEKIA